MTFGELCVGDSFCLGTEVVLDAVYLKISSKITLIDGHWRSVNAVRTVGIAYRSAYEHYSDNTTVVLAK